MNNDSDVVIFLVMMWAFKVDHGDIPSVCNNSIMDSLNNPFN